MMDILEIGVPYCQCNTQNKRRFYCECGEENDVHEWAWDDEGIAECTHVSPDKREVFFHPGYSSGTGVVRGNKPCVKGQYYYWELKMLTPMYGTDVMVGVGTPRVNIKEPETRFSSFLGSTEESWGYSYRGTIKHCGAKEEYGPAFSQGSIVGIFLDMYRGTISFHLNRQSLGVAFVALNADVLYPMVSSTAAQSGMRVIYSFSCTPSLQLLCLSSVGANREVKKVFNKIPGLKSILGKKYWWLLLPHQSRKKREDDKKISIELMEWDVT